jgi:hypothetical protein
VIGISGIRWQATGTDLDNLNGLIIIFEADWGVMEHKRLDRLSSNEVAVTGLKLLGCVMKDADIGQLTENWGESDLFRLLQLSEVNKLSLLVCEKLCCSDVVLPESIRAFCSVQLKRRAAYEEVSQQLLELATKAHIDLLFIKTLRPYPYVGSDIDVILLSDGELSGFVEILDAYGYRVLETNKHEITLETKLNGEPCLVDVHNDISAAGLVYFDKRLLWENKVKVNMRGHNAYIPSPEAELVLLAAHTVYKELSVTLADFLHAVHLVKRVDWAKVSALVRGQDLPLAFSAFAHAANAINDLLYDTPLKPSPLYSGVLSSGESRIGALTNRDFLTKLAVPYYYSSMVVAVAYLDKFRHNPRELFNAKVSRHALTVFSRYLHGNSG